MKAIILGMFVASVGSIVVQTLTDRPTWQAGVGIFLIWIGAAIFCHGVDKRPAQGVTEEKR